MNHLLSLDPEYVKENEKMLIGQFPNTYTFTKNLAEKSVQNQRGNLPVTIVRPSIIISAYSEPVSGWIDTLAAGGALALATEYGFIKAFNMIRDTPVDFVPVDCVSNIILAATAYTGLTPPTLNIVHATTS